MFQHKVKLQQNIIFLEHEIETMKKNSAYNIKAQGMYLKNLENQNHELMADRDIALKNMELLEVFILSYHILYYFILSYIFFKLSNIYKI